MLCPSHCSWIDIKTIQNVTPTYVWKLSSLPLPPLCASVLSWWSSPKKAERELERGGEKTLIFCVTCSFPAVFPLPSIPEKGLKERSWRCERPEHSYAHTVSEHPKPTESLRWGWIVSKWPENYEIYPTHN